MSAPALAPRARDALASLTGFVEGYFTDAPGAPIRLSAGQRAACAVLERGILGTGYTGAGLEMARGHGKSMLMKAAVVLAFLRSFYTPDRWGSRYAAVLTSGMLYKQFSNDIATLITGDGAPLARDGEGIPLLHRDFWIRPGFEYPERQLKERQLWNITERAVYIGNWKHDCRLSVRGMTGGDGSVRGMTSGNQRPDLLIVDDPMRDVEADNPEITEKVKAFVKNALIPAGSPNARLGIFGTPFNDADLITSVCGNAQTPPSGEWPGLLTIVLPAVHRLNGALLAPAIWTPTTLAARRVLVGTLAFSREYLLNPRDSAMRFFESAWISRWQEDIPATDARGQRLRRAMYCDPSLGRSRSSDYSAIIVLDYDPSTRIAWVVHATISRLRPQDLVSAYLNLWQQFQPAVHAVEDESAQELLIPIFQSESARRSLPAAAVPRLQSSGGVSKVTRIKRLCAPVEFGQIRWGRTGNHRELRAQLEAWGGTPDEVDDGPDALEGCYRLMVGGTSDGIRDQWKGLAAPRR